MPVLKAVFLLFVIADAGGCGSSPTGATQSLPPPATVLANFADPSSSFSTSDVRDAQDHVVNFDVSTGSLIWNATGQKYPGYPVSGNFIGADKNFQVRFGTKSGDCRAYFTETATGTICIISASTGGVSISPTSDVPGGSCKS